MMTGKQIILGLLVVSLLSPAAVLAATPPTKAADLAIQQPHYVSGDVKQTTENGTRLYSAKGEQLEIAPQNFDPENVVDFGVRGSTGSLSFASEFGEYRFQAGNGTGTYEVYWTVDEVVSGDNTTTTRTVRYTALIRVAGGVGISHMPAGNVKTLKEDANNWREFNQTLHSADYVEPGQSVETTIQEMLNWYQLRKDPLAALTGNLTAVVLLMVTTIGGGLVLVLLGVYHQAIVHRLYRRLQIFEAVEPEEGTAKEAIEELEHREKLQSLQNMDWNDLFGDDHVSAAFREQFGETVGEGTIEYLAATRPRNILRDRLQAMGEAGYVAVIEERTSTDGGDTGADDGPAIASARVEPPDFDPEDADESGSIEVLALSDASPAQLDALLDRNVLDWDSTTIRTFNLADAEYDPTELETPLESHDLQSLIAELRTDMRHFDSPRVYGEYMREFLESVREHPFCDEHGRVDELRYAMEQFLAHAQLLDDRFDYPLVHFHAEAWERAVIDYDPEAEAATYVDRVREGSA